MTGDHEPCKSQLLDSVKNFGIDAHVTTTKPLIPSPYGDIGMECPHGIRWYAEPTGEQRAAWARADTR